MNTAGGTAQVNGSGIPLHGGGATIPAGGSVQPNTAVGWAASAEGSNALPADIIAQLGALPVDAVAQAVRLLQQAFKDKSTAKPIQEVPAVDVGDKSKLEKIEKLSKSAPTDDIPEPSHRGELRKQEASNRIVIDA